MTAQDSGRNHRILVIDDNPSIHEDFRKILCAQVSTAAAVDLEEEAVFGPAANAVQRAQFELDSACQGQEGLGLAQKALAEGRPYAMAFVDVRMPPGWDGIETAGHLWELDPAIQIVLCTAYSDYSWGDVFEKFGQRDGLLILKKPFDAVEALQMAHALTEKWWLHQQYQRKLDQLEVHMAQRNAQLQVKTAFLESMVNSSVLGILIVDGSGKTFLQNQRFVDLLQMPPHLGESAPAEERLNWIKGRSAHPAHLIERAQHLYAHPNESSYDELELKDGSILERFSCPVIGQDGKYYGRAWTLRDVSERKQSEARLSQSQRLETVGVLAGGVAHEFNTILTAIIGQSELLLEKVPAESPLAANAREINNAAARAAVLTQRLLAYGRRQLLQPEILNLNDSLAGMHAVFQQMAGAAIQIHLVPAKELNAIRVDVAQIERVIVDMVANARDAMPNGGTLTLETSNVVLDRESIGGHDELKPGRYVRLAITDTGAGMSEKVKGRLFEPFFTTKGVSEGTGLALSTCYGIIKQSGGHITVYSELSHGTVFKIYLPQAVELDATPAAAAIPNESPRGTETILLVEDDAVLREMASRLLRKLGYAVLAAADGREALKLQEGAARIDLLFTDVVMPHMGGKELAGRVRALFPHTKILFSSAYTEGTIVEQAGLEQGAAILQKPYTPSALARKLREALDQPPEFCRSRVVVSPD